MERTHILQINGDIADTICYCYVARFEVSGYHKLATGNMCARMLVHCLCKAVMFRRRHFFLNCQEKEKHLTFFYFVGWLPSESFTLYFYLRHKFMVSGTIWPKNMVILSIFMIGTSLSNKHSAQIPKASTRSSSPLCLKRKKLHMCLQA